MLLIFVYRKYFSEQVGEIEEFVWNTEREYNFPQNDIIILKLKSPLTFNSKVQPACLPSADWAPENDANNKCFVSGWGALWYRKLH